MHKALSSSALIVSAMVLLGAQPMPQMSMPASARGAQPPDGITVRGSGSAAATAANAVLTLYVATRNNMLAITPASLAPVIDALVSAGIERGDIVVPVYLTSAAHTNNATIVATVHRPTTAMLQNGITQLSNAFTNLPDLMLNSAQVRLTLDDCTAVLRQAQSAALKQARSNADSLARQLGLHIGAVVAVDEQSGSLNSDGQCVSAYSIGAYQNMPFSTPGDYLLVHVYASVSIRYAIR